MTKAATKTKRPHVEVFPDIVQGTPEWFDVRRRIATASNFATIIASGKDGDKSVTRRKLMNVMAGEWITGEVAETYRNAAMERGNAMEAEARDWYGRTRFADLALVGFVRRTVYNTFGDVAFVVGCSPDALIGKDGVLEIKTMRPDLLIDLMDRGGGGFPPEHRAQIQGSLWVTDRAWCDLVIYYRGMPKLTFRVERDDVYIQHLAEQVEVFDFELRALVAKITKRMED